MQLLYNSDNFVVVAFELSAGEPGVSDARGGYEIVDKFNRKEIFIEGELAQSFKLGVQALVDAGPTEEDLDEYISRYTALAQQPVLMH
ncbi:DUF3567 domain-containing protein [Aquincola sp. S2]|uniref:DUF3567 domain-containing protein n=1 Tax=Pseudaquabacterium terrae TaxID=2732868 RepID=A0ABX2EM07_9BURK|nr:DUF3567 domain-containing protein [Aquabacterium terrae]NRF69628.1 DUF3567 domain-containing protein [Aquabacterium terrae]